MHLVLYFIQNEASDFDLNTMEKIGRKANLLPLITNVITGQKFNYTHAIEWKRKLVARLKEKSIKVLNIDRVIKVIV